MWSAADAVPVTSVGATVDAVPVTLVGATMDAVPVTSVGATANAVPVTFVEVVANAVPVAYARAAVNTVPSTFAGRAAATVQPLLPLRKPRPESSITTFVFIHCAETADGGDKMLSSTGRQQADALSVFLSDMEVAAVYVPFKKCLIETVQPLASTQRRKVEYFRDATTEAPDAMKHILDVMMEKHKGKTVVICAPAASVKIMAGMLGIKEKALKTGRGTFNEVLLVNVWWFGEAVAQKLNMNFQKKV